MPNYKKRYRRRRPYYRPARPRKRDPWKSTLSKYAGRIGIIAAKATTAYYLSKKLAAQNNAEYKHLDASATGQTIDYATPYTAVLNAPSQGDTDIQRDGDSIRNQRLDINFALYAGGADTKVRIFLIWDQDNSWSTLSDYLDQTGALAYLGHRDWDKRFKYRTLYDRTFTLDVASRDTIKSRISMRIGLHTQFENGSTNINTGALRLIIVSDRTSTSLPAIDYNARLIFTDN